MSNTELHTDKKHFHAAGEGQAACKKCRHFQEKDESIGYCSCHHVYVLSSFDCQKFQRVVDDNAVSGNKEVAPGKS